MCDSKGYEVIKTERMNRELPDWIYRLSVYLLFSLTVFMIRPSVDKLSFDSIFVFLLTIGMAGYIEMMIFIRKYEHSSSVFFEPIKAVAIPALAYVFFCMHGTAILGKVCIVFSASILICLACIIEDTRYRAKTGAGRTLKEFLAAWLDFSRNVVGLSLLFFVGISIVVSPAALESRFQKTESVRWSSERTIAANYAELKKLYNGDFPGEDETEERLKLFSAIVDVESNYLGIPYEITVKKEELSSGVCARFSEYERTIKVDEAYLDKCIPEEMIDTAAHEVRHAYQCELVKIYLCTKKDREISAFLENINAGRFRAEFADYKDHNSDILEYADQYVEQDARSYADDSCKKWMEKLAMLYELDEAGASFKESEKRINMNIR